MIRFVEARLTCPVTRADDNKWPAAEPVRVSRGALRRCRLCHACNETTMGECQPLGQLPRRLVGRGSVKRHHGRWHARQSPELRAPSVADGRYLDVVRAPANSLFESMNVHVVCVREEAFEEHRTASILRRRDIGSSEADHEGGRHAIVTTVHT